ncbi:iron-regulated ABC transporter permease protein SufD [Anseongella ginsenosidimutans]|uniref:Iron-regulated ABC transporter permease protein SufD n=1 Tax=Anseongella ginsenosidimutans TaxID=496056 RepID=A0A4R3KST7_9SPHI|nr:Fe-S cluster assembly protein SufD [Anseongella ginsenosidimutans]QEC53317.1 Fe-S cluster assembly protein SufD [Anseongella ginsenosidimutans]TCS88194.1 iron-regulated ABC transporter permease protein SufD [Anseongella ginsenosidimutans]
MNNAIIAQDPDIQRSIATINARKEEARAYFEKHGYPHAKLEDWKYTPVRRITAPEYEFPGREAASSVSREAFASYPLSGLDAWYLVFVNGWLSAELSTLPAGQKGITAGSIMDEQLLPLIGPHFGNIAAMNSGFVASNTVGFTDGAFIHAASGSSLDKPVVLYHLAVTEDAALKIRPRNLIIAEPGSSFKVIEVFAGAAGQAALTNVVTEIKAERDALVDYTKLQLETGENYHVGYTEIEQHENASVDTHIISLNGAFIRNNLHFRLLDKQCRSIMNGLYLLNGSQFLDNHTRVNHDAPECYSDQLYKGIINEQATAVFNGKIFVEKDAQKTNAYQRNVNILLSDEATINTKPQLEIFADDVRCTHGATSGHLDEEAVFYLRSRGLSEHDAKRLLLRAYAEEVIDKLQVEALKEPLMKIAAQKFNG